FDLAQGKQITDNKKEEKPVGASLLEVGITESGTIRKIVWKGAVDIVKNYPLFGSGVETFAFSYYKFRPQEHNMTSEWDFLYNKAHNEYLNYAATTGLFGLGSYLLFIGGFIVWTVNKLKVQNSNVKSSSKSEDQNILNFGFDLHLWTLTFGLFTGWLSILITNFFGFSVVIIQLFFFLIPAILFVLHSEIQEIDNAPVDNRFFFVQIVSIFGTLIVICYSLFVLARIWTADTIFAKGYSESQNQDYTKSYKNIRQSIILNSDEPLYYDEFVVPAGYLSLLTYENKDTTLSGQLRDESILASNEAIKISPNNVNFWKTRTRLFFMLGQIDEKYYDDAIDSLERSKFLSPTDPKIPYNLALLYDKKDKTLKAIEMLEETIRLKPDYKDAYMALGLFYEKEKKFDLARKEYNFILERLDPNNEDVKKRLENIKIK
ncbi:O-antigen ligase family protein, partial [Candidatus Gottesmanbacteria bacterium]|nr:O-antigen ligase family protein [Candidatus Gottesmanbacteria bacterium]